MKIKISLIITIMSILVAGCSINNKEDNYVADSVTKQKTMTKVQNDASEIIDKDYDYVIKNMGIPRSIFYYINLSDVEKSKTVEELIDEKTFKVLTYPKNTEDSNIEKSALYISLEDNKVIDVETRGLLEGSEEVSTDDSYIIIEKRREEAKLLSKDIEGLDLKKYMGVNIKDFESLLGDNSYDFKIFDKSRKENVIGYLLKEDSGEIKKALVISKEGKNIKNIKIIDKKSSVNSILGSIIRD